MSPSASPVLGKRLRLGTKSCAECRRRKVRCIFKTGASLCNWCTLHGVECLEQQGAPPRVPAALEGSRSATSGDANIDVLKNRIAHLEGLMEEMLRGGRREDGLSSVAGSSVTRPSVFESERSYRESEGEDGDADFCDAPLSTAWKEAVPVLTASSQQVSVVDSGSLPISTVRPTLPGADSLARILQQSKTYWDCWPSCLFGTGARTKLDSQCEEQDSNIGLLQESINSGNSALVAKVYLWLALCLTHQPRILVRELQLHLPRRELLNRCTQYATFLLSSPQGSSTRMDDMECYSVLWKIHFDNGRPKEAWKRLREAITLAIQLKLNQPPARKNPRKRFVWRLLWQNERHISCMLGLPSCTSNDHPGTRQDDFHREDPIGTLHHKLSLINGDIIKRDHTDLKENYATTIEMDQNLEKLRPLLPTVCSAAGIELPFPVLYHHLNATIQFYMIQKFIHMPYMMKAKDSLIYQYSFDRTVEAARSIIDTLSKFRTAFKTYMCEVMEFQLFSSAIILLLADHHRCHSARYQDGDSEWTYISKALTCLKQTIKILDCSVAKQGIHALETLISAGQTPHRSQHFEIVVPYFGRIRLRYPDAQPPAPTQDTPHSSTAPPPWNSNLGSLAHSSGDAGQVSSQPSIEFSGFASNEGTPVDCGFGFGDELGVDWGSLLDNGMRGAVDMMEFNWVTEYPCNDYSGLWNSKY